MVLAKTEARYERKDGTAADEPPGRKNKEANPVSVDSGDGGKGEAKSASKTDNNKSNDKPATNPKTDAKKVDAKKVDTKKADAKKDGSKQADAKKPDAKQADAKQADAKQADAKQADAKKPDAKKPDAKKDDSRQADAKQADAEADRGSDLSPESGTTQATAPGNYDDAPALDGGAIFAELLPPTAIGNWDPSMEAPPPGKAPAGDSRSFRRRSADGDEFLLIYRSDAFLITRRGLVGKMGSWTVTEYPHIGSAAHAYAQECSDLVGAGFRDIR